MSKFSKVAFVGIIALVALIATGCTLGVGGAAPTLPPGVTPTATLNSVQAAQTQVGQIQMDATATAMIAAALGTPTAQPTATAQWTEQPAQPTQAATQAAPTTVPEVQTLGNQPTLQPAGTPSDSAASSNSTWKFDYPSAGSASGNGWSINGLPTTVDSSTVLVAQGQFVNTIGLGSQSWIAEPGTLLVGPEFPQSQIDISNGAIERISPINQELLDSSGENFHLNEGRIDLCSFGSATLEFNGVTGQFEYQQGHNWFLIIRGLFADGQQDSDRNHTILFEEIVGSHAQCLSFPGDGFMSEEGFEQTATLSHTDAGDCGFEGCSKLTVLFVDLNTGAITVITQANTGMPWVFQFSNWFMP